MSSIRSVLESATQRLDQAGVSSPRVDAELLLAHVLGVARGVLPITAPPTFAALEEYDALLARRCERVPLQHLTGVAYFRHVELAVGPGVFVPRPETELLAGWAIDEATLALGSPPVVVDLCTGSGAIARSIVDELPVAQVYAVELDPAAYEWAQRNLTGTGVDLRQGDLATAFDDLVGSVDVVVSNPPYIPLEAWESVAVEARDHDPELALFSGLDGLDAIRAVERRAATLLRPGGVVGVEHADVQGEAAPGVFAGTGRWCEVTDHRDLAGRPRFLSARLAR